MDFSKFFTFSIALSVSILLLFMTGNFSGLMGGWRHFHNYSLLSGFAMVGIVVGHVLYYRLGWSLSTGTLFSYAAVCVFLVPIGIIRIFTACDADLEKEVEFIRPALFAVFHLELETMKLFMVSHSFTDEPGFFGIPWVIYWNCYLRYLSDFHSTVFNFYRRRKHND